MPINLDYARAAQLKEWMIIDATEIDAAYHESRVLDDNGRIDRFLNNFLELSHMLANATETGRNLLAKNGEPSQIMNTCNFNAVEMGIANKLPHFKKTPKAPAVDGLDEVLSELNSKLYNSSLAAQEDWEGQGLVHRVGVMKRFIQLFIENRAFFEHCIEVEIGKDGAKGEFDKGLEFLELVVAASILKDTYAPKMIGEIKNMFLPPKPDQERLIQVNFTELAARTVAVLPASNYPLAILLEETGKSLTVGCATFLKPTAKGQMSTFGVRDLFIQANGDYYSGLDEAEKTRLTQRSKTGINYHSRESIQDFAGKICVVTLGHDFRLHACVDHYSLVGGIDTYKRLQPVRDKVKVLIGNPGMTEDWELGGIGFQATLRSGFDENTDVRKKAKASIAARAGNNGQRCTAEHLEAIEAGVPEEYLATIDEGLAKLQGLSPEDQEDKSPEEIEKFKGRYCGMVYNKNAKLPPICDPENIRKVEKLVGVGGKVGLFEKWGLIKGVDFNGGERISKPMGGDFYTPMEADLTRLFKVHGTNLSKWPKELGEEVRREIFADEKFISFCCRIVVENVDQVIEIGKQVELKLAAGIIAGSKDRVRIAMETEYTSYDEWPKDQRGKAGGVHGGKKGVGGTTTGGTDIMGKKGQLRSLKLEKGPEIKEFFDARARKYGEYGARPRFVRTGQEATKA